MIVTPLYAGLLALWFFILSLRVIKHRSRVNLGDGGDPQVLRVMRGHANFAEYVPLILLMMAILEIGGATPIWLLHALGIALVVARLLHGYALSFTSHFNFGRFYGTLLTFVVLVTAAALCLWRGLAALLATGL